MVWAAACGNSFQQSFDTVFFHPDDDLAGMDVWSNYITDAAIGLCQQPAERMEADFSQLIGLMSYYQSLLTQDAGKLLTLRDELVDAEASLMKMIKTKQGERRKLWDFR